MRDMILPALALTAALALLLAYSASRPEPQLVWRFVDDSAAAKPLLSIQRTGEHVDVSAACDWVHMRAAGFLY